VGFAESAYAVTEADGLVSVCVTISGAVLNRNISVLLSTEDSTAVCESVTT